jgi:hypothetical protein
LHFSLLLREMKDTIETLHKKLLVYINSWKISVSF